MVTVYVGSHAGLVKAVDLMSGAVLWQVQLPGRTLIVALTLTLTLTPTLTRSPLSSPQGHAPPRPTGTRRRPPASPLSADARLADQGDS